MQSKKHHCSPQMYNLFNKSPKKFVPQNKQHSLLVLPSMNAILNFANEFIEMLTKKQSEHPQKVFQVFQVFRVFQLFHFAFGPENRPVLVQIRTKPEKSVPTHLSHKMGAQNTQKGNSPTGLRTRSCPASYKRCFFGEADFLFGRRRANLPSEKAKRGVNLPSEMAILGGMGQIIAPIR